MSKLIFSPFRIREMEGYWITCNWSIKSL